MATKRKTLSKKTRFEVFKRDGFKCQYCGAASPEAILVVDHIDPISKDGADDMMNYITACQPCNAGKSDRKLDDNTTIQKQRAQLDELNERREQLEMMLAWRNGLKDIDETQIDEIHEAWRDAAPGWSLNETGFKELRTLFKKYGMNKILDAIETAKLQYIKTDEGGKVTSDSANLAWKKIGGILRLSSLPDEQRELYYVKGILRNRLNYIPYDVLKHLQYALEDGVSVDDMKLEAKHASSWTRFVSWLDDARSEANGSV